MSSQLGQKQAEIIKVLEELMEKLGIQKDQHATIAQSIIDQLSVRAALIQPNEPDTRMLLGIACAQEADKKNNSPLKLAKLFDDSIEFDANDRNLLSSELKNTFRELLKLKLEKDRKKFDTAKLDKLADAAMGKLEQDPKELKFFHKLAFAMFAKKVAKDNPKAAQKNQPTDKSMAEQKARDFMMRYGGGSQIPGGIASVVLAVVAGNQMGFQDLDNSTLNTFQGEVNAPTSGSGDPLGTHAASKASSLLDGVITSSEELTLSGGDKRNEASNTPAPRSPNDITLTRK